MAMSRTWQNRENREEQVEYPYFYLPDIGCVAELTPTEAQHAFKVLRLREGDEIRVTDGKGHLFRAFLGGSSPKEAGLEGVELIETYSPNRPRLELAIAPTKQMERIEMVLEKMTEVGLDRFILVNTEHTIRGRVNRARLEKVMVSAMKQSRKLVATDILLYDSLPEYLRSDLPEGRYIAYCGEDHRKEDLRSQFKSKEDVAILIGPEGDFTRSEVDTAVASGFEVVSLGTERLRTETAAIYAGLVHHILNH